MFVLSHLAIFVQLALWQSSAPSATLVMGVHAGRPLPLMNDCAYRIDFCQSVRGAAAPTHTQTTSGAIRMNEQAESSTAPHACLHGQR